MIRWAVIFGLFFTIITGAWVLVHYKLWERWYVFSTQPRLGKTWKAEVEKQASLYSKGPFDLIFLGDSHMEQCEWSEVFPHLKVANRGIGGETTGGLLSSIQIIPLPEGQTVFLQIGVNDLIGHTDEDDLVDTYFKILTDLENKHFRVVPTLLFYVRYLPEVNAAITKVNEKLKRRFKSENRVWIDLNPVISKDETLRLEYTSDGIHLNAAAYKVWIEAIKKKLPAQPDFRLPVKTP